MAYRRRWGDGGKLGGGDFDISIDVQPHGWARVSISAKDRRLATGCSNMEDSLGELAAAFADFTRENKRHEICCYEEPDDTVMRVWRRGPLFGLAALRYRWEGDRGPARLVGRAVFGSGKDSQKMSKARNVKASFRYEGPFDQALRAYHAALQRLLEQADYEQYRKLWGHPFPAAAFDTISEYVEVL